MEPRTEQQIKTFTDQIPQDAALLNGDSPNRLSFYGQGLVSIAKDIKSGNYKSSSAGWVLRSGGRAEFNEIILKTISNQIIEEAVSGSGTSWTLAHTPVTGTLRLYANGQRLKTTTDFSITGATITTVSSWDAGTLLADYLY